MGVGGKVRGCLCCASVRICVSSRACFCVCFGVSVFVCRSEKERSGLGVEGREGWGARAYVCFIECK